MYFIEGKDKCKEKKKKGKKKGSIIYVSDLKHAAIDNS